MFYPQEMTEMEIIIPERDVLTVTRVLAEEGVFHQVDASYLSSEQGFGAADYWRGKSAAYAALEHRTLAIMRALGVDEGQPPPSSLASLVDVETVRPSIEWLEQETQKLVEELEKEGKRLEQLQLYIHQLEPIADVDIEVSSVRNLRYLFAMLGIMPVDNLERLQISLARIPFSLLTLRRDSQQAVVLLLGTQRDADVLKRASRSAYLNPLNLPETYQGTPAQIIEAINEDIERTRQHITERKCVMTELHDARRQQLRTLLWRVRASRMEMDAIARFGRLRYTYLIVGWVPSASLPSLTRKLNQVSDEILIETNTPRRRDGEQNAPIALDNPGVLRAFQQLVINYGAPRYGEIDPTPLVALTFPLLFGAMFGDVGHGLVLALLGGLLASRRIRALRGLAGLGLVVVACGLVATVFGFLYGSIFGLENVLPAFWLRPLENIMQILIATVGFGIVLISLGFFVSVINAWIVHDRGRMLFSHNGVAGLVFYWSLIGLVAGAFVGGLPVHPLTFGVLATVSGVAVMLSELLSRLVAGHRPLVEGSIGTYVVQGFFELFETLIGLMSNTLSYVRVGAFAVAHGGLSAVVFILAEMVSPARGVGFWVVVALGNLFIVGFEGLIVGIQTLRLEYYEFFSKFFAGGGVRYEPLTLLPRMEK
ncbi:MAG: V-type ATPase 116kDa subunit family protein [Chloroflexota bacterium]|nr:V-type ATPase 116kDa subunit family protein [Chloroflexota bacterium]